MSKPTAPSRQPREEPVLVVHPSWKGMVGWHFKRFLLAGIVTGIAAALWRLGGAAGFGMLSPYWVLIIAILSFGGVTAFGALIRRTTVYRITTRRVSESSGILSKRSESAFFSEISNTTVEQSLVERLLRIGRIDFDTAGESLMHSRTGRQANFLAWWGIAKPHEIVARVDNLRFGDEEDAVISPTSSILTDAGANHLVEKAEDDPYSEDLLQR